ncbi:GLPGLI family protein [Kaistella flava (ex Peng et al. 2021)]|uniref:GLPGLI family protein n=1 Tax=Kaistella flava (ex Peng et al. 2021) TaxID=2038776 RepID=A0A7M2Y5Q0_9FLAO|nr:GLPGLI family protein [Kaistella flava (ex Peng et al. 2021)]QOW09501.1 GLPGLI family protein [Kaistella flava (ex Peng et al. 2021)]
MNKLLFLSLFIFSFGNAQNQRFSYVYQFVPDSTNQADVKSEMVVLEVLPKFSKFYSETVFKSDSISNAILEKEAKATGVVNVKTDMRKGFFRNTIIKENPDYKTFLITRIGQTKMKVLDDRKINWKILPEKQKIGEFETQKAETEMYGRKWTAWFTTEIPIQEGPYKFHGLPGLIVKIEDQNKSHSFALNGIKNLTAEEVKNIDPNKNFVFDEGNYLNMERSAYKKFYLENRNDPNKSVRSALGNLEMVRVNIGGKMTDINEFLRDREKQQKEKNMKDNNPLELDLLK